MAGDKAALNETLTEDKVLHRNRKVWRLLGKAFDNEN